MQFLVIGYDGKDDGAAERRAKARPAHIALGDKIVAEGSIWYGSSLRDKHNPEKYIGSVFIVDFPSRKDLDEWLKVEPYVTGKVWHNIEIHRANVREPWQFSHSENWFRTHGYK